MFDQYDSKVSKRLAESFTLWEQSFENRVKLSHVDIKKAKQILKDIGFQDVKDYQMRQGQVRFIRKDDLALAMLSGLNELVKDN